MSAAAKVLDRLERVRQVAPGRWIGACPAHKDRSPSLSVRELEDGRVLVHDFGGCDTESVLAALGLGMSDLFEKPLDHHRAPARDRKHQHAAREALRELEFESLVVAVAAENVAAGVALDDADRERLILAASRIRSAAEVAA